MCMVEIKIKRGLDIPIKGKPETGAKGSEVMPLAAPKQVSLNLSPFEGVKFRLLAKVGDVVKQGQPIAEDKGCEGRMFVSPAAGVVKEIRRGLKRRILDIVIDVADEEKIQEIDVASGSREEIINSLKAGGLFATIRSRPFDRLANPDKVPKSIFVKAIESAPFVPSAEMQVRGHEDDFQRGLLALAKLTDGAVHLVYRKGSQCSAFTDAQNVEKHTAEGPHPIGTHSLHIQKIDPIRSYDEEVWTLNVHDVVGVGHLLRTGRYLIERVISIAGPGVLPEQVGYYRAREGYPVGGLIAGHIQKGLLRFISGDPLIGHKVSVEDFLGYYDYVFCVIPENVKREFMHFFRLGGSKYTFSKAYLSGHYNNQNREYDFTTNLHGEHRAFIDPTLYDQVMPLNINTMLLTKAVMAEDYDLADELGLLEVASEDFALPSFVCPSKIDMTEIVKEGLANYAAEVTG